MKWCYTIELRIKLEGVNYLHDYTSLCVAITICTTLVNTRTHTYTFWLVILLAQPAKLKNQTKFLDQTKQLHRNLRPHLVSTICMFDCI